MPDHNYFSNLIWQIADLLRGPYRPPQYERVMLPMTVLRRFDCVLAASKPKVLAEYARLKGGKVEGEALDQRLNKAGGQRFHNHSPLDFEKLKGDPDNIEKHLVSYIKGFSKNVRDIFDFFEFENEIERMREANILYLVVSKFCDVDLHPGDPQHIDDNAFEWVAVDARHRLRPGMFVAQVVGQSMEPAIPDGAYCVFRAPVEGTRDGKTVLVLLPLTEN